MKVGYLLQLGEEVRYPPFNGPAIHIRQICKELAHQGHTVRLLIRLDGRIWKSDDLVEFQPVRVRLADGGPLRWLEMVVRRVQSELRIPYFGLFESLRFALACQQELNGIDLYLERFSWMSFGGLLASKWLRVPLVLEYNGDPLADLNAKSAAPVGKQLKISSTITRWVLHQAPHIVASGEGWRKNCIDHWHVAPNKVTTIENGTELLRLLKREDLRTFGPPPAADDPTNLVYLGSFNAWHGVPILLRAFHNAIHQGVNLRLMLIGAGDGFQEAKELADQLGLDGLVTFTGRLLIDEYSAYLARSDIGLSPYCGWEEYSGLKLFDYKAAGLACIASGKDGQPATLKHGKTGLILPPCDEEALCEAIRQLACDRDTLRGMGQAARLEAETLHGWDNTVRQLEQIFTYLTRQ
jgi:glycosyltransferase involved in cell wall biosynthesis